MKKVVACGLTAAILMGSVNVYAAENETAEVQAAEREMAETQADGSGTSETQAAESETSETQAAGTEAAEILAETAQNEKTEDRVEAFVQRFYKNILGRNASKEEMSGWVYNLKSGKEKAADVGVGFIQSKEFKEKNLSDSEYVKVLYRAFFGREADSAGLKSWAKVLDEGLTRMQVYRGFAESDEFTKLCAEYGIVRGNVSLTAARDQNEGVTKFVSRCYKLCLGRKADEDGLEGWCSQILTGRNTAKKAAYGFVFSDEFRKKNLSDEEYVRVMYRLFLDREADGSGVKSWVKVLKSGKSRLHVFEGFADSPEFQKLCKKYNMNSGSGVPVINTKEAYRNQLIDIYNNPWKYYEELGNYEVTYNEFRIADATGDGIEDLIVDFVDTYTAAMYSRIYSCNENGIYSVDTTGVGSKLYTGGIIEIPESHNHTMGNAVWPTFIQGFKNGEFKQIAYYYCEEREYNNDFPYYDDKDGDGIVYYFAPEYNSQTPPIDYKEFKSKYDSVMKGHEKINVKSQNLTWSNINAIR